jgi:hypothetical protein
MIGFSIAGAASYKVISENKAAMVVRYPDGHSKLIPKPTPKIQVKYSPSVISSVQWFQQAAQNPSKPLVNGNSSKIPDTWGAVKLMVNGLKQYYPKR